VLLGERGRGERERESEDVRRASSSPCLLRRFLDGGASVVVMLVRVQILIWEYRTQSLVPWLVVNALSCSMEARSLLMAP
jgi:hypothetical protein